MLDNLKTSLRAAIKKIVNSSGIDEEPVSYTHLRAHET